MAKDQDLPLSPGKVSGVCGRLMCCLGYENRVYEEFKQGLPRIGEKVRVREGVGRVRKYNIFEDAFTVEIEGGEHVKVAKRDWVQGRRPEEAAAGAGPAAPAAQPAQGPPPQRRGGERPSAGRGERRQQGGRRPERGGRQDRRGGQPPPAGAAPAS
jgi:hypothetical protein